MFETMLQDLRYSLRTLIARPGFTAAVLLTLALAIGANTLVFSLIDGIYLTPLPYRDDATLVDVENRYPSMGLDTTGASKVLAWCPTCTIQLGENQVCTRLMNAVEAWATGM